MSIAWTSAILPRRIVICIPALESVAVTYSAPIARRRQTTFRTGGPPRPTSRTISSRAQITRGPRQPIPSHSSVNVPCADATCTSKLRSCLRWATCRRCVRDTSSTTHSVAQDGRVPVCHARADTWHGQLGRFAPVIFAVDHCGRRCE